MAEKRPWWDTWNAIASELNSRGRRGEVFDSERLLPKEEVFPILGIRLRKLTPESRLKLDASIRAKEKVIDFGGDGIVSRRQVLAAFNDVSNNPALQEMDLIEQYRVLRSAAIICQRAEGKA